MALQGTCDVIGLSSSSSAFCILSSAVAALNACSPEQRMSYHFVWGFCAALMHAFTLLPDSFPRCADHPAGHTAVAFADTLLGTVISSVRDKLCRTCLLRLSQMSERTIVEDDETCETCGTSCRTVGWNTSSELLTDGIAAGLMVIYSQHFEPFTRETPSYVAGESCLTCKYPVLRLDVYPAMRALDGYAGDSISLQLADDSVVSCTFHHDKNIHQISFTRTTAGTTEIIGMMRVNIRKGVCIPSCNVSFWGKSVYDRHQYDTIIETSDEDGYGPFSVAGCCAVLQHIASCLDTGGRIVTHPTKLECVDRDNKPVLTIGVAVDSPESDMPGIVSGYTEAWVTTATTTTQSDGIVLVEPYGDGETTNEYAAVMRRSVHAKIAAVRTATICSA